MEKSPEWYCALLTQAVERWGQAGPYGLQRESVREPVKRHKVNDTRGGPLAVSYARTFVQAHPLPTKNQQELEDHCSPQRAGKNCSSGRFKDEVSRLVVAASPGQESILFAWCPPELCWSGCAFWLLVVSFQSPFPVG